MAVRILIFHDDALTRQGLRLVLGQFEEIEIVAEAASVRDAVRLTEAQRPHVVLVAAMTAGQFDADATTKAIRSRVPEARVIVVSCPSDAELVYAAARAGASGFVLSEMGAAELAHAIRAVADGGVYLAPPTAREILRDILELQRARARERANMSVLTSQETDVLCLLARGHSNAEIGSKLFLSESTIKTHLTHVFRKLGVRDRVQAVIKAHAAGLVDGTGDAGFPPRRLRIVEGEPYRATA